MQAELMLRFKDIGGAGEVIEMMVSKLQQPVPPSTHGFKYRLVFARGGVRPVGFDNERGKGGHSHLNGVEAAYRFTSIEQLVEDFIREVEARRNLP